MVESESTPDFIDVEIKISRHEHQEISVLSMTLQGLSCFKMQSYDEKVIKYLRPAFHLVPRCTAQDRVKELLLQFGII